MRNKENKRKGILIVAIIVTLVLSSSVFAKGSDKKKALKAYSKMLSKKELAIMPIGTWMLHGDGRIYYKKKSKMSSAYFSLAYIDNDNVPELILKKKENKYIVFAVYTWKKGKVKRIMYEGSGTYSLYLPSFSGYYMKKGIIRIEWKTSEGVSIYDRHYKMRGSKPAAEILYRFQDPDYEYDSDEEDYSGTPDEYRVNKKSASRSKYNEAYKKATSGETLRKVKFKKNSGKNRKKYLK